MYEHGMYMNKERIQIIWGSFHGVEVSSLSGKAITN